MFPFMAYISVSLDDSLTKQMHNEFGVLEPTWSHLGSARELTRSWKRLAQQTSNHVEAEGRQEWNTDFRRGFNVLLGDNSLVWRNQIHQPAEFNSVLHPIVELSSESLPIHNFTSFGWRQ